MSYSLLMNTPLVVLVWIGLALAGLNVSLQAEERDVPGGIITGDEPGFVQLQKKDFAKVNCYDDTWTWKEGTLYCTGQPIGVMRTAKKYENFELVVEWCHRQHGGNSGVFVWATDESIKKLTDEGKPGLPHGVEVQILDHGYEELYTKRTGKEGDWFTTHGDVFPVGAMKMNLFAPLSPNGSRSFPSEKHSKPANQWNHYYVRAINGEIRLWVNGVEVSGGNNCQPSSGYLCLESEGAPIEFRKFKIRELP